MIKAVIIGAAGFSGLELIRILERHGRVDLTAISSGRYKGQRAGAAFPELSRVNLAFVDHDEAIAGITNGAGGGSSDNGGGDNGGGAHVAFLAVPNQASLELAPRLLEQGVRVIDLSGVFRLRDTAVFERFYKLEHTAPDALSQAVFGLPEAFRSEIATASLLSNPGCYPTGALLGLLPLGELAGTLSGPPVIDAKSGVSGAGGRVEDDSTNFMGVNENFKAYKLFSHQHMPEIEQYLADLTPFDPGTQGSVVFTPHLLPISRGILSTIYLRFNQPVPPEEMRRRFSRFAAGEPFMTLLPEGAAAELKMASHTNDCVISLHCDASATNWVVLTAIDNLLKGASGQAVQNMNLMFGLEETEGLI